MTQTTASPKTGLLDLIAKYISSKGLDIQLRPISSVINDVSELEVTVSMLEFYKSHRPRKIDNKDKYRPMKKDKKLGEIPKSIDATNHSIDDKRLLVAYIDAMAEEFKREQKLPKERHVVPLYASVPSIFYYGIINYLEARAGISLKERICAEVLQR